MSVGIRVSLCHLDGFTKKNAVNDTGKTILSRHPDGKRKEIGNLNESLGREFRKKAHGESLAFSAGAEHHRAAFVRGCDRNSSLDGLLVSFMREWFDEAGGAENGDSTENAQAGIECVPGKLFAPGNLDFNRDREIIRPPECLHRPGFSAKRQVQGRLICLRAPAF